MANIDPCLFYEQALVENGIKHAFKVTDSCLKGLLSYLYATKGVPEHIFTASEGVAVSLAMGYYLSTQKLAVAYTQNSGLANSLNPLQSMVAKEVFGIPMLLVIGWRGRPGEHDEPEHALAGPCTLEFLTSHGFPYEVMPNTLSEVIQMIARLVKIAKESNTPVALVVPNHKFAAYHEGETVQNGSTRESSNKIISNNNKRPSRVENWRSAEGELPLSRENAIRYVLKQLYPTDVTVSSVGGNSREI